MLGLGIELERVLERLDLIELTQAQAGIRKSRRGVIDAVQKHLERADRITADIDIVATKAE